MGLEPTMDPGPVSRIRGRHRLSSGAPRSYASGFYVRLYGYHPLSLSASQLVGVKSHALY
jgi:hypothetical protein